MSRILGQILEKMAAKRTRMLVSGIYSSFRLILKKLALITRL